MNRDDWPQSPDHHANDFRVTLYRHVLTWEPPTPEGRPATEWDEASRAWVVSQPELPGPYGEPFRTCSFCGSMHPEDLLDLVYGHDSVWFNMSDRRHKIWVEEIPNPLAGKRVANGSKWENGQHTRLEGIGPKHSRGKFYIAHLGDSGYSEAAYDALAGEIARRTGVAWRVGDGGHVLGLQVGPNTDFLRWQAKFEAEHGG